MKIPRHYFRKRSLTHSQIREKFLGQWPFTYRFNSHFNPTDWDYCDPWGFSDVEFWIAALNNNGPCPNMASLVRRINPIERFPNPRCV